VPLSVYKRADRPGGALQISGVVQLPDGRKIQVRRSAGTANRRLATEAAAAIEAKLLRDAYHGKRRGARSYAEALDGWLSAAPRAPQDQWRHRRVLDAIGPDVTLADINQELVNRVRRQLLSADAKASTIIRQVISPIQTIAIFAADQGWCDRPRFAKPRQPKGRTLFLLPSEADRAHDAFRLPHHQALFLLGLDTGARISEVLDAQWTDVDLTDGRINFVHTKSYAPRMGVPLSPRTVAALAALPYRDGAVIHSRYGEGYSIGPPGQRAARVSGVFRRAMEAAGLSTAITPHVLRHTWASWHYAQHRDLIRLQQEGGWAEINQVVRYAHLMPGGFEAEIARFFCRPCTAVTPLPVRAENQHMISIR
jgi:integrase